MKYKLLLAAFFLFSTRALAQPTITAVTSCIADTFTAAVIGDTPTNIGLFSDDNYSDSIIIGFPFNFYGTVHTELVIGENGMITFDTTLAGGYDPWPITAALLGNPSAYNSICVPWCDIQGDVFGTDQPIYTSLQGVAPNRTFAITWCGIDMYYCNTQFITTQVIMYESSNIIEVHIGHHTVCAAWNGGYAITGVQNTDGTAATTAPGEDYPTDWTATDQAWRFTPDTPTYASYTVSSIPYSPIPYSTATIYWYDSTTGAYIDSGSTIVVTPSVTTTYRAAALGCGDTSNAYITVTGIGASSGGSGFVYASFTDALHLGCNGDSVYLTNTSTPPGYTSYWTFGDGSSVDSVDTNPIHAYPDTSGVGTYTISLTYENIAEPACATTYSTVVTFDHPLSASFIASADTVCLGTPITFDNTSIANSPSYVWNFGDGITNSDISPVHTFGTGGIYNVTLTVIDTIPCVATASQTIDVISVAVQTTTADTSVCLVDSMLLHAIPTILGAIDSVDYSWAPTSNLGAPTDSVTTYMGLGTTTYTVTVTAYPLGCSATDTEEINSYPPVTLSSVTASTSILSGGTVNLNASGATIYTWKPDNGTLNNTNISDPIATPTDSFTVYTVYGMNAYGCLDSASVDITLTYGTPEFIPSAFTPNHDGLNDVLKVGNIQSSKLIDFSIYNRWGQLIFHTNNPDVGWDGTYNGTPQDIGTYEYMIELSHPDGTQQSYSGSVTLIR